jgi:threonine/homoserine/homoserine lactone efflux protein
MLALVMAQTLARGVSAVFLILLGHLLIEIVYVALLARGLGGMLANRAVRGGLSLVGGYVMIWMGMTLAGQAGGTTLARASGAAALPWYSLVLGGVGVSLSNPYFTSWWATVGSGQIASLRLQQLRQFVTFLFGHEMGDAVWFVAVAAILATGRQWLNDAVYQALLLLCGITVAALGAVFLWLGGRCVLRTAESPG